MQQNLLTAGEFAKLARTTKRTVLWYAAQGILEPYQTNEAGHRFYRPQQIVDFQVILLMRSQGFSLADIARHLSDGQSLQQAFRINQDILARQIANMQSVLDATNRYYSNLAATGTLVRPDKKEVNQFDIYYISKTGPYAKISDYHAELRASFAKLPIGAIFLAIFLDADYRPRAANMKIGVVYQKGMILKPDTDVRIEKIPAYTALSYTHYGSGALLSLLWQQMEQYRIKTGLLRDNHVPFSDIEFYNSATPPDLTRDDTLQTELQIPLTMT